MVINENQVYLVILFILINGPILNELKKHIVLIDDDEDELAIFDAAMSELNIPFKCTYARSAEQALNILHYVTPDFIFLDYNMPKIDGLGCLNEIKQMDNLSSVPVIMYSSCITNDVNRKAHELGVNLCFNKPSKINTFSTILKEIMQIRADQEVSAESGSNK